MEQTLNDDPNKILNEILTRIIDLEQDLKILTNRISSLESILRSLGIGFTVEELMEIDKTEEKHYRKI